MVLSSRIELSGGKMAKSQDSINNAFNRLIKKTERWCIVYLQGKPKVYETRKNFDPTQPLRIQGHDIYFAAAAFTANHAQLFVGHTGDEESAKGGTYLRVRGYPVGEQ